ncbi:MAG: hypothetical protein HY979_00600 [Candidatus Magasanikbacteria bacterium]|nr:hypothetical protein [Candidatus Magasanikbacteria bacterium]
MTTENSKLATMLSKVPEVTVFFWIIKVLCTTVGETASDFLNVNLNLGLTGTSIVAGVSLLVVLILQFRSKRYIPAIYWTAIVLISIFGTLVTDNLTDALGVPLEISTIIFSILLASTFALWYAKEKMLSIHSIFTARREAFYWLTILFTFALGTAAGDLMAESLGVGYANTGIIICIVVALIAIAWRLGLNAILAFWVIYIMTRPLGASLGDYLTQPQKYGGLGLGATMTTAIFIFAILATVAFLSITKIDLTTKSATTKEDEKEVKQPGALWQTVAVALILVSASLGGYYYRHKQLQAEIASVSVPNSSSSTTSVVKTIFPVADITDFKTIVQDALNMVNSGDLVGAKNRIADLEHDWDAAEGRLKTMSPTKWTEIDNANDKVFRQLRAVNPNVDGSRSVLEELLKILG